MLRPRIIPCLLLDRGSLIKTVQFSARSYIGDPCNTVRIFNELEVDELCVLDVGATRQDRGPDEGVLADLANEAFMPMSYGGGVRTVEQAERILRLGFEKVVVNSHAVERPLLISELARRFGSQAVVGSLDVRRSLFRGEEVVTVSGTRSTRKKPVEWARTMVELGVGELLVTSIEREGTWGGLDVDLIRRVAREVRVPIIAHGGAGTPAHIGAALRAGAAAVAVGSMVVYQGRGLGVLVNFPDRTELERQITS